LDQHLRAVIRTLRVVEVEDEGEVMFRVVLRAEIAILHRTIRARAPARVVDPAHQIVVVELFPDASQVSREPPANRVRSLAHPVTRHAAARLKACFALRGIARGLGGNLGVNPALPDESRNGVQLTLIEAEARHARGGAERMSMVQPYGHPFG